MNRNESRGGMAEDVPFPISREGAHATLWKRLNPASAYRVLVTFANQCLRIARFLTRLRGAGVRNDVFFGWGWLFWRGNFQKVIFSASCTCLGA